MAQRGIGGMGLAGPIPPPLAPCRVSSISYLPERRSELQPEGSCSIPLTPSARNPASSEAFVRVSPRRTHQACPGSPVGSKMLEAADKVQLTPISDTLFMPKVSAHDGLNALVMVTACRYFSGFCAKLNATRDVIAYELDGASSSEMPAVHRFIERTGLDRSFYEGGMDRIAPGSPADMATNALNELGVAMMMSGLKYEICAMARSTVVGYIIRKSPFGSRSGPLLGVSDFFA